jgi:bifunctional non-homologous end joining protein LigD
VTAVNVGAHQIEIGNPDKLMFPGDGITKRDVARYYARVADVMVPHLDGRPLAMERYPDGIDGERFFQKQVPDHFPEWIPRVELERERGGTVTHVVADDAAVLVYLADQACLALHRLLTHVDNPAVPVEVVFDLDPPADDPALVRRVARGLREVLDEMGIVSFVKSSGSKGLHVHVPLDGTDSFEEARAFAHDVARRVAARDPDHVTVEQRKDRRGDRLFLDWLRNSYGQHAISPFSLRALPGAPVAAPLDWDEALARDFSPRRYTMRNVFRRLARKADPWADMPRHRQSLASATRVP